VQNVPDAVVACEVAAHLYAGDDIVGAQGVAGIWEGNREQCRGLERRDGGVRGEIWWDCRAELESIPVYLDG
jgi:hypothetical protein